MTASPLDITNFEINNDDIAVICALLLVSGETDLYEKFQTLHEAFISSQKLYTKNKDQLPLPFDNE